MAMWNAWRGCKKCSDGCLHCYIHKGDFKRKVDTNEIIKTKDFEKPIEKLKNGNYKMKSGIVYLCFSTDFLIEEADEWRNECWKMIKERQDCTFLFLTKRIDRFMKCIPNDWNDGYDNVVVCCTIENQKNADYKLSIFKDLPIKHKCITAQPLLAAIDIEKYLDDIELEINELILSFLSENMFSKDFTKSDQEYPYYSNTYEYSIKRYFQDTFRLEFSDNSLKVYEVSISSEKYEKIKGSFEKNINYIFNTIYNTCFYEYMFC